MRLKGETMNNLSYGALILVLAVIALWAWDHGLFDYLKGRRHRDDLNEPAVKKSGRQ
jgi:hypothetical protein